MQVTHEEALALCDSRSNFNDERWDQLRKYVEGDLPPGQIAEFGVGFGGVTAYLVLRLPTRTIHSYCRFEDGCTAPVAQDGDTHLFEGCLGGPTKQEVERWLVELHVHQKVHLIKKDVREWDKEAAPMLLPPLAFAMIDLNLYEPTRAAIRHALASINPGGVVLVDDAEYPGVKAALDECRPGWIREGHMGVVRG